MKPIQQFIDNRELRRRWVIELMRLVDPKDHVSIFDSAIEFDWWNGDAFEFMWAFGHATEEQKDLAAEQACKVDEGGFTLNKRSK